MSRSDRYFRNKKVLITGGASGVGKRLAERVADAGGIPLLWDLQEVALERTVAEFEARGQRASGYVCDVSDAEQVKVRAAEVLRRHGAVDVLINNAGVVAGKLLLELSEAEIQRTFAVNTLALFWTTRAFLPAMIAQGSGHIVTIASAAGIVATVRQTDYAASKHAAVGFDEALRSELYYLGHRRILTTVVCPFYIGTKMFEGVVSQSPVMPIIPLDTAVEQTLNAIAAGKRRLFIPPHVATTYFARLFGTRVFDASIRAFGIQKSMDSFRGHGPG